MKQFVIYTLVLCMGMITGLQGLMIPVDRETGQPIYPDAKYKHNPALFYMGNIKNVK